MLSQGWVKWGLAGGAFNLWAFDREVGSNDPGWYDPDILPFKILALSAAFLVGFGVVAAVYGMIRLGRRLAQRAR